MNSVTQFPQPTLAKSSGTIAGFQRIFEYAPYPVACCSSQGLIIEMNSAFRRCLDPELARRPFLHLGDILSLPDRGAAECLVRDLFASNFSSLRTGDHPPGSSQVSFGWTAWRLPGIGDDPSYALLTADHGQEKQIQVAAEENLLQAQRWEAVGRLAGGVVHDFNNLLTGVMLYTDLLLSSFDPRDRRRRYAEEIRSAIVQASGLVRQLLVFARPQKIQVLPLSLNQVAQDMQDLLTRLIGENIALEFKLDPNLGMLKMDRAQAQQIVLNLVLNARDAMPNGGRIVVESSNCGFQGVAGSLGMQQASAFPCVMFAVADNGCGMDENTRRHLFEPFFTTKNSGRGTGLGLTTVRNSVATNRGLIDVESEPGRGTRVMVLLPRSSDCSSPKFPDGIRSRSHPSSVQASPLPAPATGLSERDLSETELRKTELRKTELSQEVKKETLL
jgi:signal transduction histidine kinase